MGLLVVAAVVVVAALLLEGGESSSKASSATLRPVEFLYLDGGRVLTYLEELQGGAVKSEEESHKLTKTLSATLKLQQLEAGASGQEENFIQRAVTPTTASAYMELFNDLDMQHRIKRIHWYSHESLEGLSEGQFVLFRTEAIRSPVYLDPFLALHQNAPLATLFPIPRRGVASSRRTHTERMAALRFAKEIGRDPPIVLSLQPQSRSARIQNLLPLRFQALNHEASLLKDGGGAYTVVGKVVRILPEPHNEEAQFSYVDFSAREAWRRALHQAPGALLCRSDPRCEEKLRGASGKRGVVGKAIQKARKSMETALSEQTEVKKDGAVIIPVAIYK